MVPAGAPEGLLEVPGGSLGRFRGLQGLIRTLFGEVPKIFQSMECPESSKLSILGPGRDPKMHQKSILGPKSAPRNRFLIEFSRTHRFSNFQAHFYSIFDEN